MSPENTSLPVGVAALTGINSLPLIRHGTWLVGTDSHDVTGGNNDGFRASYSYLYKRGREYVLFEESGPGCIYEIRTIGFTGKLKVYLDGSRRPRIETAFPDLYSGRVHPFVAPFVADEATAHGSSWCYVPIPFSKGCRITTDDMEKPKFFNIFAHKFARGTEPLAYDPAVSLRDAPALWSDPSTYLEGRTKLKKLRGKAAVSPRARATLAELQGQGAVMRLRLRFPGGGSDPAAHLRLRGFWDDAAVPQIDTPTSTFFGLGCPRAIRAKGCSTKTEFEGVRYHSGSVPTRSLAVGEGEDGWLYCNLPMPYWKSALIEVLNVSDHEKIRIEYVIEHSSDPYPSDAGYLHARWREEFPLRSGEDYCVVDTRGHGHFLGCVLTMSSYNGDSPYCDLKFRRRHLEGDARFYVDENRTPIVASTGTEEYFNWGWYSALRHDAPFSYPTHGYPLHVVDNEDHSVMYRFHITDLVPYYGSFRFDLEHGPVGTTNGHYSGTAFYYQKDLPGLVLTDELDICDPESEKAHSYSCKGVLSKPQRILPYEGGYQIARPQDAAADRPHVVKDRGRVWNRSCKFTVSIRSDNEGVKLRRRSYYGFGAKEPLLADRKRPIFAAKQAVDVAVDGKAVGTWAFPKRHARATWLDSDFEIPAPATRGKRKITVCLTSVGGSQWDEYTYWVYCCLSAKEQIRERESHQ